MTETLDDMGRHPLITLFAALWTLAIIGGCCGLSVWIFEILKGLL